MPAPFADLESAMRRALALAELGRGHVEPNPMVGAVIVDDKLELLGEGYHQKFGEPHAEVNAIAEAGARAAGNTLLVTLEPCCHQGKTGPCTEAIIRAGIRRVVIAMTDPFPSVDGKGIAALRAAGIVVETGLLSEEAKALTAPFRKLVTAGRPWVHAKWAMTADGRIASRTGNSKWISGVASREIVHTLRGRMDAIVVGSNTVLRDDPLLTVRPVGPRTPVRIVIDSKGSLAPTSQLVRTVDQAAVIVVVSAEAAEGNVKELQNRGVEVITLPKGADGGGVDLSALLQELGRRRMTNVLVEGGGGLFGALFDQKLIDEAHVFVAPRLIGGADAVPPIGGAGSGSIAEGATIEPIKVEQIGGDIYLHGPVKYA